MTTTVTHIDYDDHDPDASVLTARASVDHDDVSYAVYTRSTRRLHSAGWRHEVTHWCFGEDDDGTRREASELPDEVTSAVDEQLGMEVR